MLEQKARQGISEYHEANVNGFNDDKIHQPPNNITENMYYEIAANL